MPAATRFRYFPSLMFMLLAGAGLLGSCQSSRASFAFQPIVLRAATPHPAATAEPTNATAAETALAAPKFGVQSATVTAAAAGTPASTITARVVATAPNATPAALEAAVAQAKTSTPHAGTAAVWPTSASATTPATVLKRQLAAHRYARLLHRAHAPAEAGLGLTVLGLLAMLVLVVALIGLAISGGGAGWIIAAAIAAGVVLLACLDPGGH